MRYASDLTDHAKILTHYEEMVFNHNCPNVENQKCCKVLKSKGIQLKIGVIDLNFK